MNETLLLSCTFLLFSFIVMVGKYFGRSGLVACGCVCTILANIVVNKQVVLFGFNATMGNLLFASTFLITDIISEKFGLHESKKAVKLFILFLVMYLTVTQISLMFVPNDFDTMQPLLKQVFSISARSTIASVIMFSLANMTDVFLFDKIKRKFPNHLWLRNNVATIVCNCLENFGFMFIAFCGVWTPAQCIEAAAVASVIETIIGLCDTPFVYIGRKVCRME